MLNFTVFPQHFKSKSFRKGCWYHQLTENIDNYIQSGGAARKLGISSRNFGGEKLSYRGFWGPANLQNFISYCVIKKHLRVTYELNS